MARGSPGDEPHVDWGERCLMAARSAAGEASSVWVGLNFNRLPLRCVLQLAWSDILCNVVLTASLF